MLTVTDVSVEEKRLGKRAPRRGVKNVRPQMTDATFVITIRPKMNAMGRIATLRLDA